MSVFTAKARARKLARQQQQSGGSSQPGGFLGWLEQTSKATDYLLTHPISDLANSLSVFAALVTGNGQALHSAAARLIGWVQSNPIASLKTWVIKQLAGLQTQIVRLQAFTIRLVHISEDALFAQLSRMIAHERNRRIADVKSAERKARREVNALHSIIEHEAASAYRAGFDNRLSDISRIVDYLAAHNSITSRLVKDLASGVLDLAAVDDPLARLALSFLLRQLVDRLGIDRLAGAALSELLRPLLGQPRPNTLPSVIRDVSDRLGALEGQQASFWEHGGSDIEQAGQLWAGITAPLADAAVLAWLAEGVVNPVAWADQISDVLGPLLTGAEKAITAGIREVR